METQKLVAIVRYGTPPQVALRKAQRCIELGANVNGCVNYGPLEKYSSVIHIPIKKGHLHMVKLLFENGSDIQYGFDRSDTTPTPFDIAIENWYRAYSRKMKFGTTNYSTIEPNPDRSIKNMAEYRKIWPIDGEIRAYNIAMFLIKNKGGSRHVLINPTTCTIQTESILDLQIGSYLHQIYNSFQQRQELQKKIDILFALIINRKTDTSIGTQLIQSLALEGQSYLTFNDISF